MKATKLAFKGQSLDGIFSSTYFFSGTVKSKGLRWQKAEFVLLEAILLYSFWCQAVFGLPEVMTVIGFVGFDPDPEKLAIVDVESLHKAKSQFSTEMKHHNLG